MSDAYLNEQPVWRVLYEAAILEFNPNLIPQRVAEAKAAITAQLRVNQQLGKSSEDEHLSDALRSLDQVIKMRVPGAS